MIPSSPKAVTQIRGDGGRYEVLETVIQWHGQVLFKGLYSGGGGGVENEVIVGGSNGCKKASERVENPSGTVGKFCVSG